MPGKFADRPTGWEDPDTAQYIVLMTDGQITEQKCPTDIVHEENPTVELQHRPSGDKTQMRNCASSPCHDAEGNEVFQAIARQVRQLRLVN